MCDHKSVCPECGGYGIVNCVAYKYGSEETFDVSTPFFCSLPFDEEHAQFQEDLLFRGDCDTCPICEGSGQVIALQDGSYLPI